jgi:hypothetical protein
MTGTPTTQKARRGYQLSGYYKVKGAALRDGSGQIDRRKTEDRQLLRDREAFRKACGPRGFTFRRKKLWSIAERYQRVLNRVDPTVFGRASLVNKRRMVVMGLAMDYSRLVANYQDAIKAAFDELPATGAGNTRTAFDSMAKKIRHTEKKQAAKQQTGARANDQRPGDGSPLAAPENARAMQ